MAARLNIDADFLATRYRQHGRLRSMASIDHSPAQQVSIYINGTPVTGQYDECVRFHVNGYHHCQYVQHRHGWSNETWDDIDFYTFGKHFKSLRMPHRTQHFKYIHDQLPLGVRRFREARLQVPSLKLCPCCRESEETPLHFIRCSSNPAQVTSLASLRSDIIDSDTHPVRYLLADGVCHFIQSDTPYSPIVTQFPLHFQDLIQAALLKQTAIGWDNAIKGYCAKEWGLMAQFDMHKKTRDQRMGEKRMKRISSALSDHIRRTWLSRNGVLHSSDDQTLESIRSAESAEIKFYHERPHLLRTGDQHYCQRPLAKILSCTPATRRRWLRKVKQSTADMTKDGTRQTLLTNFFRPT